MSLAVGLSLTTGPHATTSFSLVINSINGSSCVGATTMSASGTLTGWCDHWTGEGTINDGVHTEPISLFSYNYVMYVTAGNTTIYTGTTPHGTTLNYRVGGGFGWFHAVPVPEFFGTPTLGNTCNSGTASQLRVSGSMEFQ